MHLIWEIRPLFFIFAAWVALISVAPAEAARDKQQRIGLSSFRILWKATELEAQSHLDVGVEERDAPGESRCEILAPTNPSESEKKWAPLDFYTQASVADQIKFALQLGRPDFFFKGDDMNRNRNGDSYKFTRSLAASLNGSLKFTQKKIFKSTVEMVVSFRRGKKLSFDGLMQVRALDLAGGCDAGLFYCTNIIETNGKYSCKPEDWTRRILGVRAVADQAGYASDQTTQLLSFSSLKETDKNDVYSLIASTIKAGEDPETAIAEDWVLASKTPEEVSKELKTSP